eukprot:1076725-Pleurochrysis_carterae.AAC.1
MQAPDLFAHRGVAWRERGEVRHQNCLQLHVSLQPHALQHERHQSLVGVAFEALLEEGPVEMRLNGDASLEVRRSVWGQAFKGEVAHHSPRSGLATVDTAGSSSAAAPSHSYDNASTSATEAVERTVTEESELCSSRRISPLQAPEWIFDATTEEDEIWKITPEDQLQDPKIRFIRESCTASKEDRETWS